MSDSEIVALAKNDQVYFGELYERYFEQIFRFVFKRLGGKENEAGDITQQTFMKAMANLGKYEDRGLAFSSWLYRIAQNEVNMYFRKSKGNYTIEIEERKLKDLWNEAEINYMSEEDQEQLVDLLNNLDQEHLDLLELRFFQEMSFKEIADIYSITEPNAKMRVYRILEKLNKKWIEQQ
jgi:RNA polymerase sigma-70 factor (ECF subfamily)